MIKKVLINNNRQSLQNGITVVLTYETENKDTHAITYHSVSKTVYTYEEYLNFLKSEISEMEVELPF